MLWIHGENDPIVPRQRSQVGIATMAGNRTEERSYPGGMYESFDEINQDAILGDGTKFVDRVVFETTMWTWVVSDRSSRLHAPKCA